MPLFFAPMEGLLLASIRIGALLLSAPWFGNRAIPAQLKICLIVLISFLLFPTIDVRGIALPNGLIPWVLGIGGELLLGIIMGLMVRFVFAAANMAGQLIGIAAGLSTPGLLNPEFDEQSTVLQALTDMVTLLVFLSTDAHHMLLRGLEHSFRLVPLLAWSFQGSVAESLVRMSAELWHIALRIGAPLVAAQFLSNVGLALLARAAPQMNVFMVAFPLQIGVGLCILALMLPMFASVFEEVLAELGVGIAAMLGLLGKQGPSSVQ